VIAVEDDGMVDLIHIFRDEDVSLDSLYSLDRDGALTSQDPAAKDEQATAETMQQGYLDLLNVNQEEQPSLTLEALERKIIEEAVTHTKGNLASAARMLGLTRAQLAYRLEKASRA
jgi:DNA-binding NtrC family response regulator